MTEKKEKINKNKKYGHVYGTRHKIVGGRFAWPHLVTAKDSTFPVEEGKEKPAPRFELTYLLPKTGKGVQELIDVIADEASEMVDLYNFDEKTGKPKKNKISVEGDVFEDGDEKDTDKYPFFAGNWVLVPKHRDRPEIFNANLDSIDPSEVEGGMPGVVIIKPICTSHGISYQLLVVQTGKDDGVRFGGSVGSAKDLLEVLDGGEESPFDEDDSKEEAEAPKSKGKSAQKGTLNLNKLD